MSLLRSCMMLFAVIEARIEYQKINTQQQHNLSADLDDLITNHCISIYELWLPFQKLMLALCINLKVHSKFINYTAI